MACVGSLQCKKLLLEFELEIKEFSIFDEETVFFSRFFWTLPLSFVCVFRIFFAPFFLFFERVSSLQSNCVHKSQLNVYQIFKRYCSEHLNFTLSLSLSLSLSQLLWLDVSDSKILNRILGVRIWWKYRKLEIKSNYRAAAFFRFSFEA